jgi:hypothetical protein
MLYKYIWAAGLNSKINAFFEANKKLFKNKFVINWDNRYKPPEGKIYIN